MYYFWCNLHIIHTIELSKIPQYSNILVCNSWTVWRVLQVFVFISGLSYKLESIWHINASSSQWTNEASLKLYSLLKRPYTFLNHLIILMGLSFINFGICLYLMKWAMLNLALNHVRLILLSLNVFCYVVKIIGFFKN